jgi:hypothetical protein
MIDLVFILSFGLNIAIGIMYVAEKCHRKALRPRAFEHMSDVWFPLRGRWMLGHLHEPTDPTRQYYKVFVMDTADTVRVAAIDIRKYDEVHNEPAPCMSVVELEEEMKK